MPKSHSQSVLAAFGNDLQGTDPLSGSRAWVGAASDWFKGQGMEHSLQIALYTLTPFYLIAIAFFLALARVLRSEGIAGKPAA